MANASGAFILPKIENANDGSIFDGLLREGEIRVRDVTKIVNLNEKLNYH